ncbi:MAG: hypothetical protein NTU91_17630, partial [Chloroflexi bacterium]|nr:hypothetical protein [Chloroflexota bacterium]
MLGKKMWRVTSAMLLVAMLAAACGGAATEAPVVEAPVATEAPVVTEAPAETGLQIPDVVDGKFNVAFVLIGPHNDGGWSQAHYEGIGYVQENVPNVNTAYIENVPEGAESEQV